MHLLNPQCCIVAAPSGPSAYRGSGCARTGHPRTLNCTSKISKYINEHSHDTWPLGLMQPMRFHSIGARPHTGLAHHFTHHTVAPYYHATEPRTKLSALTQHLQDSIPYGPNSQLHLQPILWVSPAGAATITALHTYTSILHPGSSPGSGHFGALEMHALASGSTDPSAHLLTTPLLSQTHTRAPGIMAPPPFLGPLTRFTHLITLIPHSPTAFECQNPSAHRPGYILH